MKPTKIQRTESIWKANGETPPQDFVDKIMGQCWNLIWGKVKEQVHPPRFTHSRKACLTCAYRFRCFTIRHKEK
jgi:hypothetical protein